MIEIASNPLRTDAITISVIPQGLCMTRMLTPSGQTQGIPLIASMPPFV
jgi:hypothetical protein